MMNKNKFYKIGLFFLILMSLIMTFSMKNTIIAAGSSEVKASNYSYVGSQGIGQGTSFTYKGSYSTYSAIVGNNSSITIEDGYTLNCIINGRTLKDDSKDDGGDYYTYRTESVQPVYDSESDFYNPYWEETYKNNTGMTASPHWMYAIQSNKEILYATENSSTLKFSNLLNSTCYIYIIIRETYGKSYVGDETTYYYAYAKYSFSVDLSALAPNISLSAKEDGKYYLNKATDVTLISPKGVNYSESYCQHENGARQYLSNTNNKAQIGIAQGLWTIHAVSSSDVSKDYSIIVDTTKPSITGVSNGDYYNSNKTITWNDSNISSVTIKKGSTIMHTSTSNGNYTTNSSNATLDTWSITATDKAGNETTVSFYIDQITPSITAKTPQPQKYNGIDYFEENVTLYFYSGVKDAYRVLLDDNNIYTNNTSHSNYVCDKDGLHTLKIIDKAGNEYSYAFIREASNPTGTLSTTQTGGFKGNNITNGDVSFTWDQTIGATAKLNGQAYSSGTNISADGNYTLILSSYTGKRTTTYSFTIDKTNPTISGVNNNGFYNTDKTLTWDDANYAYAVVDGTTIYSKSYKITGVGSHTISVYDLAGNVRTISFTIDKTTPEITGISKGSYYNSNQTIKWSDSNISSVTIKKGSSTVFTSTSNGNYTTNSSNASLDTWSITVTDKAGNQTTATFYIDQIPPSGNWTNTSGTIINSSSVNFNVKFTWTESNITASYNNANYTKNNIISTEGDHKIILTDKAGNTSTFSINIDKTPPVFEMTGVINNGTTNSNVTITWTETNCILKNNLGTTLTPSKSGSKFSYTIPSTSGDDNYSFTLEDAVGNKSNIKFNLDTTAPVYELIGTLNGGTTNSNVTISWTETNCILKNNLGTTLTPSKSGSKFSYTIPSTSGDGNYSFTLEDAVGNKSNIYFTLDTTPPSYSVYVEGKKVTNKNSFNSLSGVKIEFLEENTVAKLDDEIYISKDVITEEGKHTFVIFDSLGNQAIYEFQIDYTPYTENLNYFLKNNYSKINHWWETYSYTQDTDYNFVAHNTYSFVSEQEALNYALYREESTFEVGIYNGSKIWSNKYNQYVDIYNEDITFAVVGQTYRIYKSPGSKTTYIAYFSSKCDTVANIYALASITEKSIPSSIANGYSGDEHINYQDIFLYQNTLNLIYLNTDISFKNKPSDGTKLYINDTNCSYSTIISEEGIYRIKEVDPAGNITEYYLCIDTTAPTFQISDCENSLFLMNQLNTTTSIYVTSSLKISASDKYDSNAIMIITLPDTSKIRVYKGQSYALTSTGEYIIEAIDTANNKSSKKSIFLSYETPSINVTPNLDGEKIEIGFTITIEKNNTLNRLSSIQIQWWNPDNNGWDILNSDASGTLISTKNYSYYFTSSGQYQIIIIDNFNRSVTSTYTLNREAPKGYLYTTSNQILDASAVISDTSGNIISFNPVASKRSVALNWEDEPGNRYTATLIYKNGITLSENYYKNNLISEEGIYILRLMDNDSNYTDFAFEIDLTPPVGNFYSSEDNTIITSVATNQNIYFSWDEENCKCYYYTKTSQNHITYYNSNPISEENTYYFVLSDKSGNEVSYTFTIDKTPVAVTIYSNNKVVANNSNTNGKVKFVWNESKATATLNGDEYISGTIVSASQKYILIITDYVGNETSYTCSINTTPVTISIYDSTQSKLETSNYYNQPIKILCNKEEVTATLNGFEYELGTIIEEENDYSLIIIDKYGNSFTTTFMLDLTAPTGILSTTQAEGFQQNNITNGNVSLSWIERSAYAFCDGEPYTKDSKIKTEGKHVFELYDSSNNITKY